MPVVTMATAAGGERQPEDNELLFLLLVSNDQLSFCKGEKGGEGSGDEKKEVVAKTEGRLAVGADPTFKP